MKDEPYASLILVLLEPGEDTGEEHDLFDILDRMHTAPEDYRTTDEFWNEYESALSDFASDFSADARRNSPPGIMPDSESKEEEL